MFGTRGISGITGFEVSRDMDLIDLSVGNLPPLRVVEFVGSASSFNSILRDTSAPVIRYTIHHGVVWYSTSPSTVTVTTLTAITFLKPHLLKCFISPHHGLGPTLLTWRPSNLLPNQNFWLLYKKNKKTKKNSIFLHFEFYSLMLWNVLETSWIVFLLTLQLH